MQAAALRLLEESTHLMHIEQITSTQAFDALEADWRALEDRSARNSVFLGWDWQRLWWSYYGDGRQLRILVARAGGQVVGIFPLYLELHRYAKVIRVRKLRPIGSGGDTAPDDLGMLADPSCEPAVAQAFVHHILARGAGWQLLDLVDLQSDSPLAACLLQHAEQQPTLFHRAAPNLITYGDLPADWDSYRQSLSRNRRELLGRKRRKFAQQEGARFYPITEDAQIDAAFDRLAQLHRLRWQGRTEKLSFSSAQYLGFHRSMMHALCQRKRLLLYALELQGEVIAMFYGFRKADTCYYFQAGFDPAHAALSPGEVLMGYVIEAVIGAGCTTFDMLKGDYDHKRHYFQQTRQTVDIRVYRPGLIHLLYRIKQWRLERRAKPQPHVHEGDAMQDKPTVAEQVT